MKKVSLGCILVALFLFSVPGVQAQTPASLNEEAYRAILLELIDTLLAQITLLQAQQEQSQRGAIERTPEFQVQQSKEIFNGSPVLNRYILTGPSDVKAITNYSHRVYLQKIYEIFPDEYDAKLQEFLVFKDKKSNLGAFVQTIPPTHLKWTYAVNTDALDFVHTKEGTELIVHELAHLISYEEIIGVPLPAVASCRSYFRKGGCPKNNSYLTAFADAFWSGDDLDRAIDLQTDSSPIDEAYDYFEENETDFVSGYAALSPEEDFAESFAAFVVDRGIQRNTLASEKVWWFDQFAELQTIRNYIR